MEEQSSRLTKFAAAGAIAGALAIAGIAATGCGSDNNSGDVNSAIDSVQSQASSIQSQATSVASSVQSQATSVSSQVQSQVQSIQSQIQTQTQSNGGSGAGGY
jgi:phage-related protein